MNEIQKLVNAFRKIGFCQIFVTFFSWCGMHLRALAVAEQHLSCHKGIVPLPVTLAVVDA